jgi:hypothetical protein
MPNICGKNYTKTEVMKYIGDISQIADARESTMTAGRGEGTRIIDVKNGKLNFTVVPSRSMDIAWSSYKGIPLSFISKAGITAPAFYEAPDFGFLRSFSAGLVMSCGLSSMGMPSVDEGEAFGLHGRISQIPAADVCINKEWIDDEYKINITGKMRESGLLKENLSLKREIETYYGSKQIRIRDEIVNDGFDEKPLMMIYHINFGFPLVADGTRFFSPCTKVTPRDDDAAEGIENYNIFDLPKHGAKEQMFFHDFKCEEKEVSVCLFNQELQLGICLTYDRSQLPYFGEWKMMGEGDYTCAFEPGTWLPLGRDVARARGELPMLQPGEKKIHEFTLTVLDGEEDLSAFGYKL